MSGQAAAGAPQGPTQALPVGNVGPRAAGWWGMLFVVLAEGSLIVYLLFSYYYFAVRGHAAWPPGGPPSFATSLPSTAVLLASSAAMWWAERGIGRGERRPLLLGLAAVLVLGLGYLVLEAVEISGDPFTLSSSLYGSIFLTITGVHMAHAAVGVLALAALLLWSGMGYFDRHRYAPVAIGALYWHFVVAIWIPVFFTLYVVPYLR